MLLIEKNIVVTDVDGNHIGTTYPKRARGLVKNGRAEYVSDREIRLKSTRAPAVYTYTEDAKMSKVIEFNTRDFKFEDTCKSNVGFRGFVSTALGNEEIWFEDDGINPRIRTAPRVGIDYAGEYWKNIEWRFIADGE